ncbi:MAG: class I SAM-dependent methyltransferase [Chloroflexi bacterium]|nr:MAG: class I SAM-dependent methyltransferase [Chloroflexota bacterium]MBL1194945.1 class I SAM-dependent methyltransferase [Chloroflexota bacterium]NOH12235.1 class I SAM-dependent methyltransferase [Chloroflexota bacterium]
MDDNFWEERQRSDSEWFDQKYQFEDYPRHEVHDRSFVRAIIHKLQPRLPSKLLDLGCGLGWYSYLFSQAGFEVTGADMSPVGIQGAQNLYPTEEIDWVVGDGLKLDFHHEFDIVHVSNFSPFTMVDSLETEQAKLISGQIMRYLKQNGLLVFVWNSRLDESDPQGTWANYSIKQIARYFEAVENANYLGTWATHSQLSTLFGSCSLSNFVTQLTAAGARFHSKTARIVAAVQKL